MRPLALAVLVCGLMTSGCLESPSAIGPQQEADGPPAVRAPPVFHLHHDGTSFWMDLDPAGPHAEARGVAATEGARLRFPFQGTLDEPAEISALSLRLPHTVQQIAGSAPRLQAALLVDGTTVGSGTADAGSEEVLIATDVTLRPGDRIELETCICATGTSTFTWEARIDETARAEAAPAPQAGGTDVRVYQADGRWHATQTLRFHTAGEAEDADVTLRVPVGSATIRNIGPGSSMTAILTGSGDTEAAARARLAEMTPYHEGSARGGTFTLDAGVRTDDGDWQDQRAEVTLDLEWSHLVRLQVETATADQEIDPFSGGMWRLESSTGDIDATGLDVDELFVATATGDATIAGTATSIDMESATGQLAFTGQAADGDVSVATGEVSLDVDPTASGSWSIVSSTGEVHAVFASGSEHGYDVEADTSTGRIDLDFQESEPVGAQDERHQHVRTRGYSDRSIQTSVQVSSSTGDIRAGT